MGKAVDIGDKAVKEGQVMQGTLDSAGPLQRGGALDLEWSHREDEPKLLFWKGCQEIGSRVRSFLRPHLPREWPLSRCLASEKELRGDLGKNPPHVGDLTWWGVLNSMTGSYFEHMTWVVHTMDPKEKAWLPVELGEADSVGNLLLCSSGSVVGLAVDILCPWRGTCFSERSAFHIQRYGEMTHLHCS